MSTVTLKQLDPESLVVHLRERAERAAAHRQDADAKTLKLATAVAIRAAADAHPIVRRQAAWALAHIGTSECIELLRVLATDADRGVRREAAGALRLLGREEE